MIIEDNIITHLKMPNGSKVIGRSFSGKKFSKKDIKKLVKQFEEKYKNKNLTLMLTINTPYGFRSAKQFSIHDEPILVDDYDWTTTNSFIIYGWKKSSSNVGANEMNDCLFQCILDIVGVYRLPKTCKTDLQLKSLLNLQPKDKIPLQHLPQIEKVFKININVTGDYFYTSSNCYNQTVHLLCSEEHVSLVEGNHKNKDLLKHLPFKKQHLVLVKLLEDEVQCYNGKKIYNITYEDYYELTSEFLGNDVYVNKLPFESSGNLVSDYNYFIAEAEKLQDLTKGKIDLSKYGYKVSNQALKLVHYDLLSYNQPDKITLLEQEWLVNCFKGGLIFSNPDTSLDHAYLYDVNSAYPNMLCSDHFSFPLKEGEFKKISKLEDILQYGIYRCSIKPSNDENVNKLFRFNTLNYYTHIDINLARTLKLDITLIQNEQSNVLLYVKGRANGSNFFRHIVHTLYDLKKDCKLAKAILNAIWGVLCSRNKIRVCTGKEVNLKEGDLLLDIQPIGSLHKITYLKNNKYFKYDYARLGCFLTSAVRKQMADYIYPVKEHVFRCHTDSILSSIPLPLKIGIDLGEFKLEKEGKVTIENSNIISW